MTCLLCVILAFAWSRTATVSTYSEAPSATHAQSTAINGASAAAELSTGSGAYRPDGGVALQKDGGSFGFAGVAKLEIPSRPRRKWRVDAPLMNPEEYADPTNEVCQLAVQGILWL